MIVHLDEGAFAKYMQFKGLVRCGACEYNYGLMHGGEFNEEDIVCEYFATDGQTKDDYCSHGKRYAKDDKTWEDRDDDKSP